MSDSSPSPGLDERIEAAARLVSGSSVARPPLFMQTARQWAKHFDLAGLLSELAEAREENVKLAGDVDFLVDKAIPKLESQLADAQAAARAFAEVLSEWEVRAACPGWLPEPTESQE